MAVFGFGLYSLLSAALAYLVVAHAYATREQFYPTVIYLVTSKFSIVVLCNMAFVMIVALAKFLKTVFLGELRQNEVERVNENLRYSIPEICIALTVFREELSLRILGLFAMLLFSKFFHVVSDERMNFLEMPQGATVTRLQHLRLMALVAALFLMNAQCLAIFGYILGEQGHSVLILFAFEYCILELDVIRVTYRYAIDAIARRVQAASGGGEWANRNLYLMYGKLAVDLLKLFVYVMYFLILFTYYQMPMHMIRDLGRSFMEVQRELGNVIESRKLRAQMNRWFKAPTVEELERYGAMCVVCHDEISAAGIARAKKLTCNHIFHVHCLLSWWERQRNCPMCRADILPMLQRAEQEQLRAARDAARNVNAAVNGANVAPRTPALQGQGAAGTPAATGAAAAAQPGPRPTPPMGEVRRTNISLPASSRNSGARGTGAAAGDGGGAASGGLRRRKQQHGGVDDDGGATRDGAARSARRTDRNEKEAISSSKRKDKHKDSRRKRSSSSSSEASGSDSGSASDSHSDRHHRHRKDRHGHRHRSSEKPSTKKDNTGSRRSSSRKFTFDLGPSAAAGGIGSPAASSGAPAAFASPLAQLQAAQMQQFHAAQLQAAAMGGAGFGFGGYGGFPGMNFGMPGMMMHGGYGMGMLGAGMGGLPPQGFGSPLPAGSAGPSAPQPAAGLGSSPLPAGSQAASVDFASLQIASLQAQLQQVQQMQAALQSQQQQAPPSTPAKDGNS